MLAAYKYNKKKKFIHKNKIQRRFRNHKNKVALSMYYPRVK